jgi:pimeloyl-ACP methyl ester carboxylesterase
VFLSVGRFAQRLLDPLMGFIGFKTTAEMFQKGMMRHLPPADRVVTSDKAIRDRLTENTRENLRQKGYYILPEVLMVSQYWGFEIDSIEVFTEVWHGESDRIVSPETARGLAKLIPRCRTHFLPGNGHFLLYHCWREILLSAISEDEPKKILSA